MLSEQRMWASAFARQALADLDVRETVLGSHRCYQLHFLQMATEKICKAYLHDAGNGAGHTHAVIRKHLPVLARKFGASAQVSGFRLKQIQRIAVEIELLAPALHAQQTRQDNTEYPWKRADGRVMAPIDCPFDSIDDREVGSLIKLLRIAAGEYATLASFSPAKLKY